MSRLGRAILTLSILAGSPFLIASAQDDTLSASENTDAEVRPIEEITVLGDKTMAAVRFQLRLAEDDLFAMFNELNSRDEFDIDCKNIRYTRSNLARRTCEPKFLALRRRENASFVISQLHDEFHIFGTGNMPNYQAIGNYKVEESELRIMLAEKFEAMGEDMLRIASENPDYLKALVQVESLKRELDVMWEDQFGH